jgi:hypothetical protein
VSDQPAAIEDFEHLNVTIVRIGFGRANDPDDKRGGPPDDRGNGS